MKEHQNSSHRLRTSNYAAIANTITQGQAFATDVADKVSADTPCIIVRVFSDLHHFLSWFQIDVQQPLIFPFNRDRYIKQDRDCITISGFENLEEFLACFARDGSRRPSVPPVNISALIK